MTIDKRGIVHRHGPFDDDLGREFLLIWQHRLRAMGTNSLCQSGDLGCILAENDSLPGPTRPFQYR